MSKERFAFIIAAPRSGTNFFRSLLRNAAAFYDCGEITDESGIEQKLGRPYFNYFSFVREKCREDFRFSYPLPEEVEGLLDEYLAFIDSSIEEPRTILLDVKYTSVHNFDGRWRSPVGSPNLMHYIASRNIPVLHLIRNNALRVYVSEKFAEATNLWLIEDGSEPPDLRIRINPGEMLARIDVLQREIAYYRREFSGLAKLAEIHYADLAEHRLGTGSPARAQIEQLFGAELPPRLKAHIRKIVRNFRAVVENMDDVEEALQQQGLSELLSDAEGEFS